MGSCFIRIIMGSTQACIILIFYIASTNCHVPTPNMDDTPTEKQPGVADLVKLILGYITPRDTPLPISAACKIAGDNYTNGIMKKDPKYLNMLDASALMPPSGFLGSDQSVFHHPGSFSECLGTKDDQGQYISQYCLLTVVDTTLLPPEDRPKVHQKDQLLDMSQLSQNEHFIPDTYTTAAGKHWGSKKCSLVGKPRPQV